MKMQFVFDHIPIPKMRHRHTKGGWTFDPQEKVKQEVRKNMANLIHNELNSIRSGDGRVNAIASANSFLLRFLFEFPIPESDSNKSKNQKQWGIIPHNKKPDLSNLMKFYEDCANGVLFPDDAMIIGCQMEKRYSPINQPRVIMTVEPQKEMAMHTARQVLELMGPCRVRELMKACHVLSKLPLSEFEQCESFRRDEYLQLIASSLIVFANEFAIDLTKVKKNCATKIGNTHC